MIEPSQLFRFHPVPETDGAFRVDWTVPESLPYFAGHFPGAPVLPAVAILDASVEMIRRALSLESLALRAAPTAKFTGPVLPGAAVAVRLAPCGDGAWDVAWRDPQGKPLAQLRVCV